MRSNAMQVQLKIVSDAHEHDRVVARKHPSFRPESPDMKKAKDIFDHDDLEDILFGGEVYS